jgi:hypothetical protein
MGARIQCPKCKGTGGTTTGRWQIDCGVCKGSGWLELPIDQIVEALKPHLAKGINLLKEHLVAYAEQRKVQKAIENSLKNMGKNIGR